jgi:hypothetical protein
MSMSSAAVSKPRASGVPVSGVIVPPHGWWRAAVPIVLAVAIALPPPPPGLEQHAWYYFALSPESSPRVIAVGAGSNASAVKKARIQHRKAGIQRITPIR